jgi:hypothetical protein
MAVSHLLKPDAARKTKRLAAATMEGQYQRRRRTGNLLGGIKVVDPIAAADIERTLHHMHVFPGICLPTTICLPTAISLLAEQPAEQLSRLNLINRLSVSFRSATEIGGSGQAGETGQRDQQDHKEH